MWTSRLSWLITVILNLLVFTSAVDAVDSPKKRAPIVAATSTRSVTADKSEASPDRFILTESNGPWMVFAASFAGPGAEDDALALVRELRQRRIPAYLHAQDFDFSKPVQGLGLAPNGKPRMMKYKSNSRSQEWAVLVGDYPSVDDSRLQSTVEKLKGYHPDCIKKQGQNTTLRFAELREFQKRSNKNPKKNRKGPLGHAFVTRNPLLPAEASSASGIDSLVLKMNRGLKYSLLECPANHTVRIATFRGKVVIDQKQIQAIEDENEEIDSKLDEAANKADRLVQILRRRGEEAYQFHDRYASYVTVGSFDSIGTKIDSGDTNQSPPVFNPSPAIFEVMQKYGPQKKPVIGKMGREEFVMTPQIISGIHLDMQPFPMEIPRHSIAADYGRSMVH